MTEPKTQQQSNATKVEPEVQEFQDRPPDMLPSTNYPDWLKKWGLKPDMQVGDK
jgi:hypothetical protein